MLKSKVYSKFTYDIKTDKSECHECKLKMTGKHAANLMRHLQRKHKHIFDEITRKRKNEQDVNKQQQQQQQQLQKYNQQQQQQQSTINYLCGQIIHIKISKDAITKRFLDLVPKNKRSLTKLEISNLGLIIEPICMAFEEQHFIINRQNIKDLITAKAKIIRDEIIAAMRNRMISLKVDLINCTDHTTMVCIKAQLIHNGEIKIYTLAMKELNISDHLYTIIIEVLQSFDVSVQQIYTYTVDNSHNVDYICKAADMLLEDDFEQEECCCQIDSLLNTELDDKNIITILNAVHMLNLVATKFFIELQIDITKIRYICRELRTFNYANLLRANNLNRPVLDCIRRWNTTYKMCESLLELKDFCMEHHGKDNLSHLLSAHEWEQIKIVVDVLRPLYEATIKVQSIKSDVPLLPSDCFVILQICWNKIRTYAGKYNAILLNILEGHSTYVINSAPMKAAVYFDPRFQILLSSAEKETAKQHIFDLYQRLDSLNCVQMMKTENLDVTSKSPILSGTELLELDHVDNNNDNDADDDAAADDDDEIANFLYNIAANQYNFCENQNINDFLKIFDGIQQLPPKANILKFWESSYHCQQQYKNLANTILALPFTQVSMERQHSKLKYLLHNLRHSIDENLLEDIILINLN